MNKAEIRRWMRREFSKIGWALVIYYCIKNAAVTAVCVVDAWIRSFSSFASGTVDEAMREYMTALQTSLSTNGWGYIFAMILGAGAMLLWKKRDFCFNRIWILSNSMTGSDFVRLLVIFVSGQAIFQIMAVLMEAFFSLFGISILSSIESATGVGDTVSMLLYACIFAPVGEEILFRGLILRSFQPFGKKFAIVASAFLFGIFHGNIVQSPYAFFVGLVLGYVAMEYSMIWAIVLHMFNNLVLGDIFPRAAELIGQNLGNALLALFIWGCAIAALVILIVNRNKLRIYKARGRIHPWPVQCFFSSAGILFVTGLMIVNMLLAIFAA